MAKESKFVGSTSDDRTANNAVRHQYRVLSEDEKAAVTWYKDIGTAFIKYCDECGETREMCIAKERMEEAVMWAVKAITA